MTIAKINNIAIANIAKINKKVSKDYVKLLIQFDGTDGANTYTAETGQTVTFVGTAQLDTAQKKFGTASLLLDGNSDYVTVPDSDDWSFGTGDFTIDCCIRFNNIGSDQAICSQYQNTDNLWVLTFFNDEKYIQVFFKSGGTNRALYNIPFDPVVDTWYHIAIVRNGISILGFINGLKAVVTETIAISTNDVGNVSSVLAIGSYVTARLFNGWIDGLRVTKGLARWIDDFNVSDVAPGLIDIAKVNNVAI